MPYLVTQKGPIVGQWFPLDRHRTSLGRHEDCDIVLGLADPDRQKAISQRHAVIVREQGNYYLADGDGKNRPSKNHTFVNHVKVPFPGRVLLKDKDVIEICYFTFAFHDGSATPIAESSSSVELSVSHDSGSMFTQPAEKLRLLLEIGNRLSHTLSLDVLLPQVVESLMQAFKQADHAFLIEVDEASGELVPRILKSRRQGEESPLGFSAAIVEGCLRTVKGLLSNDPEKEFAASDSVAGLSLRSVMGAPLWTQDGKAFGVLLLDSLDARKKFTEDDLNFLMGVASQASIALANARYHRDTLLQERLNRDMILAREVVKSFLPANLPKIPGYEFFAFNESALAVGGDYYDLLELADHRLGILLGDVAGKGVSAALVMARFSAEARACLRTEIRLDEAVRRLNTIMQPLGVTDRFMSLAALLLDPDTHTLTLVNAGHPSPLILRHATGALEEATPNADVGLLLGVLDGYPYEARQVVLKPGDNVVIYSDGVTEALDAKGQQLGTKGLGAVLQRGSAGPKALGERILQAVKDHAAGCDQADDITLVCFGRLA